MTKEKTKPENRETAERGLGFGTNDDPSLVREASDEAAFTIFEERTAQIREIDHRFCQDNSPKRSNEPDSSRNSSVLGPAYAESTSKPTMPDPKKEFLKNIGTCRKEARETEHFVRMAVRAVPEMKSQARASSGKEARELHLIFSKIWRTK